MDVASGLCYLTWVNDSVHVCLVTYNGEIQEMLCTLGEAMASKSC
jgi:hypothetical protein